MFVLVKKAFIGFEATKIVKKYEGRTGILPSQSAVDREISGVDCGYFHPGLEQLSRERLPCVG